jgi:hypothetical protein
VAAKTCVSTYGTCPSTKPDLRSTFLSDNDPERPATPALQCTYQRGNVCGALRYFVFYYSVAPTWDRGQNLQRLGASYLALHQLMAAWLGTAISRVTDWTSTSSAPYLCALSLPNIKLSFLCNCQLLTIYSYWPLGHVLKLTISICKQNQ